MNARWRAWLLVAWVVVAFAGRGLWQSEMPQGHDTRQYFTSLAQMESAWASGQTLPQWAPQLAAGQGEPLYIFLPPLPYMLAAIPHALGTTRVVAFHVLLCLWLLLGTAGVFALVTRWTSPACAALAAVAWAWAPYGLCNLYIRGAWGEWMAHALTPWLACGMVMLWRSPTRRGYALVAGATAAIVLTHLGVAFMAAATAATLLAMHMRKHPRAVLRVAGAAIHGAVLSSFFWVPAWLLKGRVHSERLLGGYNHFSHHFVAAWQWLDPRWHNGLSWPGTAADLPQPWGLAFALAAGWLVLRLPWAGRLRGAIHLWLLAAVGTLFMTLAASGWLWGMVRPVAYLQFPMRWLGVAQLAGAVLVGLAAQVAASTAAPRWHGPLWVAAAVLLVAPAWSHARAFSLQVLPDQADRPGAVAAGALRANSKDEFLPADVWNAPAPLPWEVRSTTANARVTDILAAPLRVRATVTSPHGAHVEMARKAFVGWHVQVDGKPQVWRAAAGSGVLGLDVPPGVHAVEASWRGTPQRAWGLALAALGALAALAGLWRTRRG